MSLTFEDEVEAGDAFGELSSDGPPTGEELSDALADHADVADDLAREEMAESPEMTERPAMEGSEEAGSEELAGRAVEESPFAQEGSSYGSAVLSADGTVTTGPRNDMFDGALVREWPDDQDPPG